jgi:hypothetical protein
MRKFEEFFRIMVFIAIKTIVRRHRTNRTLIWRPQTGKDALALPGWWQESASRSISRLRMNPGVVRRPRNSVDRSLVAGTATPVSVVGIVPRPLQKLGELSPLSWPAWAPDINQSAIALRSASRASL